MLGPRFVSALHWLARMFNQTLDFCVRALILWPSLVSWLTCPSSDCKLGMGLALAAMVPSTLGTWPGPLDRSSFCFLFRAGRIRFWPAIVDTSRFLQRLCLSVDGRKCPL